MGPRTDTDVVLHFFFSFFLVEREGGGGRMVQSVRPPGLIFSVTTRAEGTLTRYLQEEIIMNMGCGYRASAGVCHLLAVGGWNSAQYRVK